MVLKWTVTPIPFNFSVMYSEFVSWRAGLSISEPTAMISDFIARDSEQGTGIENKVGC
jgi:hypothetical protein